MPLVEHGRRDIGVSEQVLHSADVVAVFEQVRGEAVSEGMAGRALAEARADALLAGLTINGLPILNEEPDLEAHYRARVIGGPGAFCVPARDYRDFREAIRDKLVREIRFVA